MTQFNEPEEHDVLQALDLVAKSIFNESSNLEALSNFFEVTGFIHLKRLDYWERFIRDNYHLSLSEHRVSKFTFWRNREPFLTWLDICSWDGFKRERAIRSLSGPAPNRIILGIFIRRINDWVPQVRLAAREKIKSIAELSDPKHVVDAICFTLTSWTSWQRLEEVDKNSLLEILELGPVTEALVDKIKTTSSGPMGRVFAQISRSNVLDCYLQMIAKCAAQPSVRARAYRALFDGKMAWFEGRKFEWVDKRYCVGRMMPIVGERLLSISSNFVELLKQAAADIPIAFEI